jgi:soluble lytic murein transglycosylase-like protein
MIRKRCLLGLVLFALASAPCLADIYAFVDDEGHAHFSNVQIDDRYKLFMKSRHVESRGVPDRSAEPAPIPGEADATAAPVLQITSGIPISLARRRYADMITRVAREQKVDPALLHAVVTVESGYNPRAKSPKGATGLMQLMPGTARQYGVSDIWDPLENLRGGARYLRALLGMFDNNLRLAIAAYNAGEGAVIRAGRAIPPYPETQAYVPRVLKFYEQYRSRRSGIAS